MGKSNTFRILPELIALLYIFIALAVSTYLTLRSEDVKGAPLEAPTPAVPTVSRTVVTEAEWPEIIKATGPILAWQEAVIGAEISGQRLIAVMADVRCQMAIKRKDRSAKWNRQHQYNTTSPIGTDILPGIDKEIFPDIEKKP